MEDQWTVHLKLHGAAISECSSTRRLQLAEFLLLFCPVAFGILLQLPAINSACLSKFLPPPPTRLLLCVGYCSHDRVVKHTEQEFLRIAPHMLPCSHSTPPLFLELLDWQARAGLLHATCSIPYNDLCVFCDTVVVQWSANVKGNSHVCLNVDLRNWHLLAHMAHGSLLTRPSCWVKIWRAPGYWYGKQFRPSVCVPRAKLAVTTTSLCSLSLRPPPGVTKTRNSHRLLDRSSFFLMGWHWEPSRINLLRPPESCESRAEAIRGFVKMNVRMTSACSISGFKLCSKPHRCMAAHF